MKVVLDSNVLLVAIGKRSRFKPIWEAFLEGKYQLIISEDIIHEYEEILRAFFTWNAISADPDDNKFFDAAVAGDADYLVTNDAHFNEVKDLNFPKVNVIDADNFISILKNL